MLDATGGSSSPASKMAPELSRQEQEQHPESEHKRECSVAEASPRSPDRNGQNAKITCEKEEGDKRLDFCNVCTLCVCCVSPECVSLEPWFGVPAVCLDLEFQRWSAPPNPKSRTGTLR